MSEICQNRQSVFNGNKIYGISHRVIVVIEKLSL